MTDGRAAAPARRLDAVSAEGQSGAGDQGPPAEREYQGEYYPVAKPPGREPEES